MKVLADTHTVMWYLQGGGALSATASQVLREAAETDLIVVSAATLVDLWYLRSKQREFTHEQIRLIRDEIVNPVGDFALAPVNLGVVDAFETIDADALRDPWDRLITATAMSLELPLVGRDRKIAGLGLVEVIW
ncbi:MAG: type II toxin-antitoxin system VapC family toxin [Pseudonocardiaceae bacterium]